MKTTPTIFAALLAMTAPAVADRAPCQVRFVRAPDDVRHVIEQWLAAEPRCTGTLDLRVIPTESGYYLMAQRPDGRLHERFVPDAQSAGVLVASWVADDWIGAKPDVWSTPRAPAAQPVLLPPAQTTPAESISAIAPRRGAGDKPRWITAGAMLSAHDSDDGGLRLEVDLIAKGNFVIGAALAWSETTMPVISNSSYGYVRSSDVAATVYGGYTLRHDRWELRGALGVGGVYSDLNGMAEASPGEPWPSDLFFSGGGSGFITTGSATLTRRLGERWGIHAGVVGHVITERLDTDMGVAVERNDSHLFLFTGLRRRI